LARGYSITQNTTGNAIIDSAQLQPNEQIQTRFRQGAVISRVIEILD
jgi:exodeoxyribonuclease VII large subunit